MCIRTKYVHQKGTNQTVVFRLSDLSSWTCFATDPKLASWAEMSFLSFQGMNRHPLKCTMPSKYLPKNSLNIFRIHTHQPKIEFVWRVVLDDASYVVFLKCICETTKNLVAGKRKSRFLVFLRFQVYRNFIPGLTWADERQHKSLSLHGLEMEKWLWPNSFFDWAVEKAFLVGRKQRHCERQSTFVAGIWKRFRWCCFFSTWSSK